MLSRRVAGALLVIGWAALGITASPAGAHQRADLEVVSPAEGADVAPGPVEVVVAADGASLTRSDFSIQLDGAPVDTSGRVGAGSVFTTFSLAAGDQLRLRVSVRRAGEHELRLQYAFDADDPRPDVVRRFTTRPEPPARADGGLRPRRAVPIGLAGAGVAALAAAFLVRRRVAAAAAEDEPHLRD